jgi:hypothetical protein
MRERKWLMALSLACVLPHATKLGYYPDYPGFDDAFIHLRVAENLAHGKGWGINAFEPINVSSSPLFTLILSVAYKLRFPDVTFSGCSSQRSPPRPPSPLRMPWPG